MTTDSHDAVNYHKMGLEEQTRREVAHESDATRTLTTRKSQSGAADTREPNPRIGTKRRSLQCVLGGRNSNPIAAGDGKKRDSASQPRGEMKNADQTDVKDKEKNSQGRNPRIREERAVPTAGKDVDMR